MDKFKLLPDRPIDAEKEEDIKFGHKDIAETLFELIDKAEPPFTIGLYGRWGVGKTTISSLVEKKAKKAGVATFFFDVWKYEQDSLRRQLLIELDKELNLNLNYKEILNQSLTIDDPTKAKLIFDSRLLFNRLGYIFLIIFVVGVFARLFHISSDTYNYFSLISDVLAITGLSGFLLQAGTNTIIRAQQSVTTHRTDSAEGFEDRFKEALNKIPEDKLLIIIDNLDRIEDKKMVEILSDIKTFLSKDGKYNKDKVVFLIPCDNSALRSQLLSTYGKNFDADEFLRKFFNLTFEIPKFINIDLNEYVQALIKETEVIEFRNDSDLESVIIYAFRDNPREIKQFINSLTSTFLLAKKRKLVAVISNPAFLAKMLVIRQKFQPIYKIFTEKALRGVVEFNSHYFNNQIFPILTAEDLSSTEYINNLKDNFLEFEKLTEGINHSQVALFISLRQSEIEESVPDAEKLILSLEESRKDDAVDIFNHIILSNKKNEIDEILRTYVTNNNSGQTYINFVVTLLNVLNQTQGILPKLLDEIATRMPDIKDDQIELISPEIFINFFYKNTSASKRKKLRDNYFSYISSMNNANQPVRSSKYVQDHIKIILENEQDFNDKTQTLRNYFESHLFWFPYILLIDTKERKIKYITDNAKKRMISSIDVIKSPREKGELFDIFNYMSSLELPEEIKIEALIKCDLFVDSELKNPSENRQEIIFGIQHYLELQQISKINNQEITAIIERISVKVIQMYDSEIDDVNDLTKTSYAKKDIYYYLFDTLISIESNNQKGALIQMMGKFFQNAPVEIIQNKDESYFTNILTRTPQFVINKGIAYPNLLIKKKVLTKIENSSLKQIIDGIANSSSSDLPFVLKDINYSYPDSPNLINIMLPKLNSVSVEALVPWLDSLKKLGIGSNSAQIDQMFKVIKTIKEADSIKANQIKLFIENNKELFNQGQLTELGLVEENS